MFDVDDARELLTSAQVFFDCDPDDDPMEAQTLNLNDAFYWACADGEHVADNELLRVSELFWRYGIHGIYYWVLVEKRNNAKAEFLDVNRFVEFVTREEELRKAEPSSSRRAYQKVQYTIGTTEPEGD